MVPFATTYGASYGALKVSPPVRFGPYEVNLDSGDLRKFGYRVRLQPKSFLVLRALLERPANW